MSGESMQVRFLSAEPAFRHWIRPERIRGRSVMVEHWENVAVDVLELEDIGHPPPKDGNGALTFEFHDGRLAWARVEGSRWAWGFSAL